MTKKFTRPIEKQGQISRGEDLKYFGRSRRNVRCRKKKRWRAPNACHKNSKWRSNIKQCACSNSRFNGGRESIDPIEKQGQIKSWRRFKKWLWQIGEAKCYITKEDNKFQTTALKILDDALRQRGVHARLLDLIGKSIHRRLKNLQDQ